MNDANDANDVSWAGGPAGKISGRVSKIVG